MHFVMNPNSDEAAYVFIMCMLNDISELLGGVSNEEITETVEYFDYKCPYTGEDISEAFKTNQWVLDQLFPFDKDFASLNLYGNSIVTTPKTQIFKGEKSFEDYIRQNTQGTEAEKEARIKKIKEFQIESGYFDRVKNIEPKIKELCQRAYNSVKRELKDYFIDYKAILESNKATSYEKQRQTSQDFDIKNGILRKYEGCSTKVRIPETVVGIGDGAFKDCTFVEYIEIPDSVKTIGADAFRFCLNLKRINLPDSITLIGDSSFEWCMALESIIIPNSVQIIGSFAFNGCTKLKKIILPKSILSIKQSTFSDCASLENIVIPESTQVIDAYAFCGCKNLKEVKIPNSISIIGQNAFMDCRNLKEIQLPVSINEIGDDAFRSCNIHELNHPKLLIKDGFVLTQDKSKILYCTDSSKKHVVIPPAVKEIGDKAFIDCDYLKSVVISNSVEKIGSHAFQKCENLTRIEISNSVKTIGVYAFIHCKNLVSVTIPDSVKILGHKPFSGCSSLDSTTKQRLKELGILF